MVTSSSNHSLPTNNLWQKFIQRITINKTPDELVKKIGQWSEGRWLHGAREYIILKDWVGDKTDDEELV